MAVAMAALVLFDRLTIVSLDWGFNEQLIALADRPRLVEPIWAFALKGVPDRLPMDPGVIYLLHPEKTDISPSTAHSSRRLSRSPQIR